MTQARTAIVIIIILLLVTMTGRQLLKQPIEGPVDS